MRVLHIEGGRHLYGGARQVLYLLEGLAQRGVTSGLICRTGSEMAMDAASFAEVLSMDMGGDLDLALIPGIYRRIRHFGPDVLHLHSRIGADVMGGIAGRLAGVKVVHSRRVDNPEPTWRVKLKYRLHDRVIAISEGIGAVLLAAGLPSDKLRVVRSAVDFQAFGGPRNREVLRERLGVPVDSPVIGVVAQLIARKGHRFLIQALPPLIAEFPALRVLFFGQGPESANLERTIAAAGLADQIRLCGFRSDLPDLLPCLDLLVHPALLEGLGVSLLQASSAGVPVIASRVGGIPEAVREGLNGLLVPPGDVAALGAAIARLLRDPDLARRLGRGGRILMSAEFSIPAMVEGNLAVYRELVPTSRVVARHG
jgi:glycosyltransferase involved in cell wall biosynthesis